MGWDIVRFVASFSDLSEQLKEITLNSEHEKTTVSLTRPKRMNGKRKPTQPQPESGLYFLVISLLRNEMYVRTVCWNNDAQGTWPEA